MSDSCSCCNKAQIETLIVIGLTSVITGLLWHHAIAAPLKLIAVFLHEFGHASATWLTGGKVVGIEVNDHFGGVTVSQGGTRWIVLSAGYTGSVIWGAFFIIMTWDNIPTRIAAVVFMMSAIATFCSLRITGKQSSCFRCEFGFMTHAAILLIGAIPAGLWILEANVLMSVHPLRWCMLMLGTTCTLHAVFDCLHDVLLRKIDNDAQGQSDAVMFATEIGGGARCWGLLFSIVALAAAAGAVLALLSLHSTCFSKN